jgi:hypothetical protein
MQDVFPLSKISSWTVEPSQSPLEWVPGVKQQRRKAGLSLVLGMALDLLSPG